MPAALTLARRRRGAGEAQRLLGERRDSAEPGKPGAPAQMRSADPDMRAPDASSSPLVPASAVERVVIEAGRMADRPFVEMAFGRDLRVRLTRSPRGVEILLEPGAGLRGAVQVELPGLVAAVRARGVAVARIEVRASDLVPKGSCPPAGALTKRRGSATTAPR